VIVLVVLVWGNYANSLRNGFVWDDKIILSRQLVVFDSLRAVLVTPRNIPQFSPDYYRPLTVASFLLDRAIGGDQPFTYHLSVIAGHAGVSLLVLALVWILLAGQLGGRVAAVVAAALFAVHPIHTESVAWIAGRSDVLATGFLLAALLAHLRLPRGWSRAVSAGVLSLAALAAKETAISIIPLLVLSDLFALSDGRERWRAHWADYVAVAFAAMLYLALRNASVGGIIGESIVASPVDRSLVDLVGAVGAYLIKLIWPAGLNAYIDTVPVDAMTLVITLAAVTVLVGVAVWAWLYQQRVVTFLILWLALTLAPSLAVVWRIPEAPMAERYLYLPSVAFCLLCGVGVSLLWRHWMAPGPRWVNATTMAVIVVVVPSRRLPAIRCGSTI
jgi:hypothetical protein